MTVEIKCRTCGGRGLELVPHAYETTLEIVPFGVWMATAEVFAQHGKKKKFGLTAVINRLRWLEAKGLVVGRRSERGLEWRRL